jgi:hypothetical protein
LRVWRFDRDAERTVVGAVLLAGSLGPETGWAIFDRAAAVGVVADAFYSYSLGALWSELARLREARVSLDALTVSAQIEREAEERVGPLGELLIFDAADLRGRLHELAHEVTAFSNVEHHGRIVVREAERRAGEAA